MLPAVFFGVLELLLLLLLLVLLCDLLLQLPMALAAPCGPPPRSSWTAAAC
jgi:hypothetical protein